MAWVEPVCLVGEHVSVVPYDGSHAADLAQITPLDTFAFFPLAPKEQSGQGFDDHVERIRRAGSVPLTMVLPDGTPVGLSTYMDLRPEHLGLEIGHTFIGVPYRRTKVNPEAKLLMLTHAFETLGAVRVQLKTDERNIASQGAMRKLGLREEGTIFNHMVMPDGHVRNTVMFSVTRETWPELKAQIMERLGSVGT